MVILVFTLAIVGATGLLVALILTARRAMLYLIEKWFAPRDKDSPP